MKLKMQKRPSIPGLLAWTLLAWLVSGTARADSVVVFNEIMYHPATNEAALEWVELHNQMAVNVDLSGWSLNKSIAFTFPEGTVIPGWGYLLVAVSPADLMAATGANNVLGPFSGRLSNAGETIELLNRNQRVMDAVTYGVEGDWPVGANGAGVSLAKYDEDSASADAANWRVSAQVGGTPGAKNFPVTQSVTGTTTNLVAISASWRYEQSGTDLGTNWSQANFDDSAWPSGQALLAVETCGCLPEPIRTTLTLGQTTYYFRTRFNYAGDPATAILWLRHVIDDGAVVYLNGGEVWRIGMPAGAIAYTNFASRGITDGAYEGPFTVPSGALVNGTNVLAVEVHQNSAASTDITFGLELNESHPAATGGAAAPAAVPLAFNELSSVTNAQFTVEIINHGTGSVALAGNVLARFGTTNAEYVIPTQTLAPGAFLVLDRAALGFGADPGDRVVLYSSNKTAVLDAVVAKRYPRARFPDGTGTWLHPSQPSFGASNVFTFHNEIVINEIMYHPPDLPVTPQTYFTSTLLTMTNVWRYSQLAQLPAGNWFAPGYDDRFWPSGQALFYNISSPLTAPKNTLLNLSNSNQRIITYYFRAPFVCSNNLTGLQLSLRHIVDDGAVFYLNGVEVYRYGLPAGAIGYANLANANILIPTNAGPFTISATNLMAGTNLLAVEVHQYSTNPILDKDMAFGAELTATGIQSPPLPVRASPEAWVELYNRSTNTVDLMGWSFTKGIQFTFPDNKSIAPGGYLVVAGDAAYLRGVYPAIDILGDFTGSLSHSDDHFILTDPAGNPADEVHYFDDKPWPGYAAGGGSSIEVRDPWADNSKAAAWAASIESGRAGWVYCTNRMVATNIPAANPTTWNEFQMGLLDAGECLIDDLHVTESPTNAPVEMLQNGTFETGLTAWRALGTHAYSRVELDPDNMNNHVLHVIATGATEHMHNHLETTYASSRTVSNGRLYEVTFRAKWLAGNNRFNTRLYFNRVAKTFVLPKPQIHGTPGTRNSTYATNVGPTFEGFSHSPVIPSANQPVTVSVNASDPQGVASVALWWSTNFTTWQTVPMSAGSGAASPGYANYTASMGGLPAGTLVQFFVRAADGLGAVSTYPAGGTNSRALFKVDEGKTLMTQLHRYRLLMLPTDADLMYAATNVMSNVRQGLTFVYDERQVFYDAGVHLVGSLARRPDASRNAFSVRVNADQLFRGVQSVFKLDRSGGWSGKGGKQDEMLLWQANNHAGGGSYGVECDLGQVFAPRSQDDSTCMVKMSAFDASYFAGQFKNGDDGNLFKLELIYYPTATVTGDPQAWKPAHPFAYLSLEIGDWGDDPENYRWNYLQENHADQDDYSQIVALAKAFSLTGAALDATTTQLMDVDQWMRAIAIRDLAGDIDTLTRVNCHNALFYFRPDNGKALLLPWDMDDSFTIAVNASFPGNSSANTYKLITTIPNNLRRYYNHLYDLSTTTMNAAHLTPWANHYAGLVGQNWSGVVSYIQQRADYMRGFMPLNTPFAITNNSGNNFATTNDHVTLAGTAPMTVRDFQVNGLTVLVTWLSLTNWILTVPLPAYTNLLVVQGVDNAGSNITSALDSIMVTNTAVPARLPVVVNEWMSDNAGAGGYPDPVDGAYKDWFELYNPNAAPVSLSGFFLTDTLTDPTKWTIPTNTVIAGHGFMLVWADSKTNLNGQGGDLHANFQLSKNGEAIGLFASDGTPQHTVTFGLQYQNVSQGLFPDGNPSAIYFMTNWTPRAANQLGAPPSPGISGLTLLPGGNISFDIAALVNRNYRVEYNGDLATPAWIPLSTNRAVNGVIIITDNPTGLAQRFYRVLLLP